MNYTTNKNTAQFLYDYIGQLLEEISNEEVIKELKLMQFEIYQMQRSNSFDSEKLRSIDSNLVALILNNSNQKYAKLERTMEREEQREMLSAHSMFNATLDNAMAICFNFKR